VKERRAEVQRMGPTMRMRSDGRIVAMVNATDEDYAEK
jgi:ERCC4-related helicase